MGELADARDDMTVFREYEPRELGHDGYPHAWHGCCGEMEHDERGGVKHRVRAAAGDRCQRCGHPYRVGSGQGVWEDGPKLAEVTTADELQLVGSLDEVLAQQRFQPGKPRGEQRVRVHWSPCDIRCTHGAPTRWRRDGDAWVADGERCAADSIGQGVYRGFEIQAAWRILTVHHLNERKHDLRWWNLAALCQRCHLTIQRKVTMEDPWPWEHSEWFRPHAAAWYALRYLGEHLTYTHTIARLDELLALGREQEQVERMAL